MEEGLNPPAPQCGFFVKCGEIYFMKVGGFFYYPPFIHSTAYPFVFANCIIVGVSVRYMRTYLFLVEPYNVILISGPHQGDI